MINPEVEAEILRLHHAEKWLPGMIARQLRLHHSVVTGVIGQGPISLVICLVSWIHLGPSTVREKPER